jgi:hypothetical protein
MIQFSLFNIIIDMSDYYIFTFQFLEFTKNILNSRSLFGFICNKQLRSFRFDILFMKFEFYWEKV